MMRVFFHVQHLLGIGHLKRAATICRALAQAGFEVTLASGGLPADGTSIPGRLVQLPPLAAADATFKLLVDERGRPIDDDWRRARGARLLEAWREARADVLVVELFPFGRRALRFELLPLLEEAREALVVCSVRDLLQPRPGSEAETLELFERYFDRLLVHGDPRIAPFGRSFAGAARLEGRLAYTGYVVAEAPAGAGDAGRGEVLVSAGGGAVGASLLDTALRARPMTRLAAARWRVLTGANASPRDVQRIARGAGEGVAVERSRQDFTALLRNCEVSVSQAGYNTVMETLQARARAVVVPFAQGAETEQGLRARLFAERGLLEAVEERDLSPERLAKAIDRAALRPRPESVPVDLDGARRTAALLREWAA